MTFTNDPPIITDLSVIPGTDEKADLNAPADSGGKLVIGQAPNITITETNVVADAAERLALDVQEGDVAIQTNVSTSFIFTGGDNVANNWETLDFDAVGAIAGEDIAPGDVNASGNISLQDLTVAGAINGADTSAAAAGEALTSDGSGGFSFASVGGIETVDNFADLSAPQPPAFAYVTGTGEYYRASQFAGSISAFPNNDDQTLSVNASSDPDGFTFDDTGTRLWVSEFNPDQYHEYALSTPFDLNSASGPIDVYNGVDAVPRGISFEAGGTRFFESGSASDVTRSFDVGTPYDLDTLTSTGAIGGPSQVNDHEFSPDGKFFIHGRPTVALDLDECATPFDFTSRTNIVNNLGFSRGDMFEFTNGGTELLITSDGEGDTSQIDIYDLDNPFRIDQRSFRGTFETGRSGLSDIEITDDNTKLFVQSISGQVIQRHDSGKDPQEWLEF